MAAHMLELGGGFELGAAFVHELGSGGVGA